MVGRLDADAYCNGAAADPDVTEWCASYGGCYPAFCGDPPGSVTERCVFSEKVVDVDGAETPVWCCVQP